MEGLIRRHARGKTRCLTRFDIQGTMTIRVALMSVLVMAAAACATAPRPETPKASVAQPETWSPETSHKHFMSRFNCLVNFKGNAYPWSAVKRQEAGRIVAEFSLDSTGKAQNFRVLDGGEKQDLSDGVKSFVSRMHCQTPKNWDSQQGSTIRFQIAVVFLINPDPNTTKAASIDDSVDDVVVISAHKVSS